MKRTNWKVKTSESRFWIWACSIIGVLFIVFTVLLACATLKGNNKESRPFLRPGIEASRHGGPDLADRFYPPVLRSLVVNPQSKSNYFDFVLDEGNKGFSRQEQLDPITRKLIQYFFLGITLPSEDFWVNLNPVQPDKIASPRLTATDIGKVLLEVDLNLKKDAARFTDPRTSLGQEYWARLKDNLTARGVNNPQMLPLSRLWIVPDEAVMEEVGQNRVNIVNARLKICLESEYLKGQAGGIIPVVAQDAQERLIEDCAISAMKEVIVPVIEHDVNYSARYAPIRQVYYSLILAEYFKQKYWGKKSIYDYYINQGRLTGLYSRMPWSKRDFFNSYVKSYQQGEYSFFQQEYDPYQLSSARRHYFSGGIRVNLGDGFRKSFNERAQAESSPVADIGDMLKNLSTREWYVKATTDEVNPVELKNIQLTRAPSSETGAVSDRGVAILIKILDILNSKNSAMSIAGIKGFFLKDREFCQNVNISRRTASQEITQYLMPLINQKIINRVRKGDGYGYSVSPKWKSQISQLMKFVAASSEETKTLSSPAVFFDGMGAYLEYITLGIQLGKIEQDLIINKWHMDEAEKQKDSKKISELEDNEKSLMAEQAKLRRQRALFLASISSPISVQHIKLLLESFSPTYTVRNDNAPSQNGLWEAAFKVEIVPPDDSRLEKGRKVTIKEAVEDTVDYRTAEHLPLHKYTYTIYVSEKIDVALEVAVAVYGFNYADVDLGEKVKKEFMDHLTALVVEKLQEESVTAMSSPVRSKSLTDLMGEIKGLKAVRFASSDSRIFSYVISEMEDTVSLFFDEENLKVANLNEKQIAAIQAGNFQFDDTHFITPYVTIRFGQERDNPGQFFIRVYGTTEDGREGSLEYIDEDIVKKAIEVFYAFFVRAEDETIERYSFNTNVIKTNPEAVNFLSAIFGLEQTETPEGIERFAFWKYSENIELAAGIASLGLRLDMEIMKLLLQAESGEKKGLFAGEIAAKLPLKDENFRRALDISEETAVQKIQVELYDLVTKGKIVLTKAGTDAEIALLQGEKKHWKLQESFLLSDRGRGDWSDKNATRLAEVRDKIAKMEKEIEALSRPRYLLASSPVRIKQYLLEPEELTGLKETLSVELEEEKARIKKKLTEIDSNIIRDKLQKQLKILSDQGSSPVTMGELAELTSKEDEELKEDLYEILTIIAFAKNNISDHSNTIYKEIMKSFETERDRIVGIFAEKITQTSDLGKNSSPVSIEDIKEAVQFITNWDDVGNVSSNMQIVNMKDIPYEHMSMQDLSMQPGGRFAYAIVHSENLDEPDNMVKIFVDEEAVPEVTGEELADYILGLNEIWDIFGEGLRQEFAFTVDAEEPWGEGDDDFRSWRRPLESSPVSLENVEQVLTSIVERRKNASIKSEVNIEDFENFPWKDGEPVGTWNDYAEDLNSASVVEGRLACTTVVPYDVSVPERIKIYCNRATVTGEELLEYVLNLEEFWDIFDEAERSELIVLSELSSRENNFTYAVKEILLKAEAEKRGPMTADEIAAAFLQDEGNEIIIQSLGVAEKNVPQEIRKKIEELVEEDTVLLAADTPAAEKVKQLREDLKAMDRKLEYIGALRKTSEEQLEALSKREYTPAQVGQWTVNIPAAEKAKQLREDLKALDKKLEYIGALRRTSEERLEALSKPRYSLASSPVGEEADRAQITMQNLRQKKGRIDREIFFIDAEIGEGNWEDRNTDRLKELQKEQQELDKQIKQLSRSGSSPISRKAMEGILTSMVKKTKTGHPEVEVRVEDFDKFPWKDGKFVYTLKDYSIYQEELVVESLVPRKFACTIVTPDGDAYEDPYLPDKIFRIFRNKDAMTPDEEFERVLSVEELWEIFGGDERDALLALENSDPVWKTGETSSPITTQPQDENMVGGVNLTRITFKVIF